MKSLKCHSARLVGAFCHRKKLCNVPDQNFAISVQFNLEWHSPRPAWDRNSRSPPGEDAASQNAKTVAKSTNSLHWSGVARSLAVPRDANFPREERICWGRTVLSHAGTPLFSLIVAKKCHVFRHFFTCLAPFGRATMRRCINFCFFVLRCSRSFQRVSNRIICATLLTRLPKSCYRVLISCTSPIVEKWGPPSVGCYWESMEFY